MKNNILKLGLIYTLCGYILLHSSASVFAQDLCSSSGYSIISINGMLTEAKGAVYNKNMLSGALKMKTYNNQKIIYDYVYNPTHGFFADFVDAITQKTSEKMFISDTHDLKNMLVDLSAKVKTQKLLIVAHSQGNFYANDIYRTLGDKEGGVSKSSMGIYGIGTPTSYIAGGGKYILSKNDSVINKIRLFGMMDILPANVDIPKDEEDEFNGHGLSDSYLKYEDKRISAEIMTMLHGLKEDNTQDVSQPCINPPEITMVDEAIDLVYEVLDPIQDLIADTARLAINDIAKPVFGVVDKLGRGYMRFVNSLFSTAGTSTSQNNKQTDESKEDENIFVGQDNERYLNDDEEDSLENRITQPVFANNNNNDSNIKQLAENSDKESFMINKRSSGGHKIISDQHTNNQENNDDDNEEDEGENIDDDVDQDENTGNDEDADENSDDEDLGETENPPLVTGDIVPPVIFLLGDANMRISKGTTYVEPGATANDFVDGVVEVEKAGEVNIFEDGIYTIIYKAKDKTGNQSTKERIVEVYTPLPGLYIDENTELPAGEYFFENITVTNNATLTLLADNESITSDFRGVKINAKNITVDSGATISSDNVGFLLGPGTMTGNQSGGSYGGKGEYADEEYIYGSALYPKEIGSGGGIQSHYYKGGGAIWLEVSDMIVNNGMISASGGSNASGGSVYVNTKNLSGSGVFRANGGGVATTSIFYYPGGGGRTVIHYDDSSFSGIVEATAGSGHVGYPNIDKGEDGTAGLFDKKNRVLYVNKSWEFVKADEPFEIENVTVSDMAEIRFQEGTNVFIDTFVLEDSSKIILNGEENFETGDLFLKDWATITTYPEKVLNVKTKNLYIESNATINAQSLGLQEGSGTPSVEDWGHTGASYGGKGGGEKSKPVYGNENLPVDFGSGAEGFRGGGAIKIEVAETLLNDGTITTDGYPWRVSGGSVYIKTNTLEGEGKIYSRGADGYAQGSDSYNIAGGGGRIAVYYKENNFDGEISSAAGRFCFYGCHPAADDGTVVLVDEDSSSENLILSFSFDGISPSVIGVIDNDNSTVFATVPQDIDLTTLVPTINISPLATIDKASLVTQDFSSFVIYTVTAENGLTKTYTVSVSKGNELVIPIDDIDPVVISYSLNATTEDITIDPAKQDVIIEINSSENVDWVSIEIEKVDETSIRKLYLSGENCVDGTNHCSKTWRGELSNANTILKEGDYHINVHIKDASLNETFYTIPSLIKVKKANDSEFVEIVI